MTVAAVQDVQERVVACRACPRLVAWREQVAREKRRAFRDQTYWGRAVPSFGDFDARVLIVGLAPAAHGANRTGRMFTGDASGDWLFRALHRAGMARMPTSTHAGDGQRLDDVLISAALRCAPPVNRPRPDELDRCREFLQDEIAALDRLRVVVCLGGVAWRALFVALTALGRPVPRPRPRFGHLAVVEDAFPFDVVGSYHPSQYNTSTRRLTEPMLDAVFSEVSRRLDEGPG